MADTPGFTTRPELAGTFGMVASTHWLASAAGMAVLEHGGNAFDAAVAAGLVSAILNGIFGLCLGCEMYLLIRRIWPGRHKLVPAEADKEV